MSEPVLVYIHLNDPSNPFPEFLYDNLYQAYLMHASNPVAIYIIINRGYIRDCSSRISRMNIPKDFVQCFHIIPVETLKPTITGNRLEFMRFVYLAEFMKQFHISKAFHIENDVMLYTHINHVYRLLCAKQMTTRLIVVQDAPTRALGSIVYIPAYTELERFLYFSVSQTEPLNDTLLLGLYKDKDTFPNTLDDSRIFEIGYYDGVALGQYINHSVVNDTSTFNPSTVKTVQIWRPDSLASQKLKFFVMIHQNTRIHVQTLHVHSKQLYLFSSIFQFKYSDLVCLDNIRKKCEMVVVQDEVYFHERLLDNDVDLQKVVPDESNILVVSDNLPVPIENSTVYICNDNPSIPCYMAYAWNVNSVCKSLRLLPRGTDCQDTLFDVMTRTYYMSKTDNLLACVDDSHIYHSRVMNVLFSTKLARVRKRSDFSRLEYLEEIARHRFVLCIRGSSVDTTQFWEALYLRTIPVIVNNKHTQIEPFVSRLRALGVPFYEIKHFSDFCRTHDDIFFSEELYTRLMNAHFGYEEKLKLNYYSKN